MSGGDRKPRSRANGEGSIYSNGRGRFVAEAILGWKDNGRPDRVRRTFDTKAEARQWLTTAFSSSAEGLDLPNDRITVSQWLDRWLATLPGKVSDSTLHHYRTRTRLYIKPHLGTVPLRKLSPSRVSSWVGELATAGLSGSTQAAAFKTLRRALSCAQRDGLVMRNVASLADGPRATVRPDVRWTTSEEVIALLDAARVAPARPECLTAAVATMAGTGIRGGELLGLRWSDIDLTADTPTLTVRHNLSRVTMDLAEPKSRRTRTIPLPAFTVAAIKDHRRAQAVERLASGPLWVDRDLVITNEIGQPMTHRVLARRLESLAVSAEIPHVNGHALRHGAVSIMLADGVELSIISEVVGHASLSFTRDTYGHLLTEHLTVAANALDRAIGTGS